MIGELLVLIAVNVEISPVPDVGIPILGVLFVHAYVVVPTLFEVVKLTAVESPSQSGCGVGVIIFALGLTVIVNTLFGPSQTIPLKLNIGVT